VCVLHNGETITELGSQPNILLKMFPSLDVLVPAHRLPLPFGKYGTALDNWITNRASPTKKNLTLKCGRNKFPVNPTHQIFRCKSANACAGRIGDAHWWVTLSIRPKNGRTDVHQTDALYVYRYARDHCNNTRTAKPTWDCWKWLTSILPRDSMLGRCMMLCPSVCLSVRPSQAGIETIRQIEPVLGIGGSFELS